MCQAELIDPERTGHLRIVLDEPGPLVTPPVEIIVEAAVHDDADRRLDLEHRRNDAMKSRLGFRSKVVAVAPESLERTSLKSKLVVLRSEM